VEVNNKPIRLVFWATVAVFIIIICAMFVRIPLAESLPLGFVFLPGIAIFFLLGVALIVLTVKKKVPGLLKKFLLLTGASAAGLPVFAVLHNVVSGFFNIEEAVFFILATLVCPLGFLVGAAGTIVLAVKNKPTVLTGT
jgi:peptidoglycan/LPS O-acetylase OafA/YrhL